MESLEESRNEQQQREEQRRQELRQRRDAVLGHIAKKAAVAEGGAAALAAAGSLPWILTALGLILISLLLIAFFVGVPIMVLAAKCQGESLSGELNRAVSSLVLPVDVCDKLTPLKGAVQAINNAQAPKTTPPQAGGGQPPVITLGGGNLGVREMDSRNLGVIANDPDGDNLNYKWLIESDETGKAELSSALTSAVLGIKQGSPGTNSPTSIFEGKKVVVRVDVSDGKNTVSTRWNITVVAYNRPPVGVIEGILGTPQKRLVSGGGIAPNGEKSFDPDGTPVSFQWGLGQATGGSYRGTVVCTGCNGPLPGFSIPDMTAAIDQEVFFEMEDGLHKIRAKATAYLAPR